VCDVLDAQVAQPSLRRVLCNPPKKRFAPWMRFAPAVSYSIKAVCNGGLYLLSYSLACFGENKKYL
jgi:hypothetical protein